MVLGNEPLKALQLLFELTLLILLLAFKLLDFLLQRLDVSVLSSSLPDKR